MVWCRATSGNREELLNTKNYRSFHRKNVTLQHILHGMNDIFIPSNHIVTTFAIENRNNSIN